MKSVKGFWFSPTYDCNNRCWMCYAGGKLASRYHVPLNEAKEFIGKMAQAGAQSCILVGGEPTRYRHIVELVSFISGLGLKVKIMSNGRALASQEFVQKLKQAGLDYCAVSIEGVQEVHDSITRVLGSFSESISGLQNLMRAGIKTNSITTVSSYNLEHIDDLVQYLQKIKVRVATFNMCSAQPSGYQDQKHNGQINLEQYARVVESIGLRYDFVRFYALVPLCLFDQQKLSQLISTDKLKISCSLFGNSVAIDPYGNITPCTHMPDLSYGNLNSPDWLTNLLKAKTEEKEFLKTHGPNENCTDCQLWTTCYGGCNLIWFTRNAQTHIPGLTHSH